MYIKYQFIGYRTSGPICGVIKLLSQTKLSIVTLPEFQQIRNLGKIIKVKGNHAK